MQSLKPPCQLPNPNGLVVVGWGSLVSCVDLVGGGIPGSPNDMKEAPARPTLRGVCFDVGVFGDLHLLSRSL